MNVNMMEELPKLLVNNLEQLLCEKKLLQWNLQDNGNCVYINLKFGIYTGLKCDSDETQGMGLRKKSPSERHRDFSRLMSWKEKRQSNNSFHYRLSDNGQSQTTREYRSPSIPAPEHDHGMNCELDQSCETDDPFDQTNPHVNENKRYATSTVSSKKQDYNLVPTIAETFVKVVHNTDTQTLHGLTYDRKIAVFDCLSPPETQISSGELAVIDRNHEYYDNIYSLICRTENVMDDDNYTESLKDLCQLTFKYNTQSSSAIT